VCGGGGGGVGGGVVGECGGWLFVCALGGLDGVVVVDRGMLGVFVFVFGGGLRVAVSGVGGGVINCAVVLFGVFFVVAQVDVLDLCGVVWV
ncbi:hypothetical protein, partial [Pseudomonas syringae group genomosp. 7]|uniref:hypothetical protein n=1 Tax=Pseudomonas syringae group genomosp. 7 TaxID=251699 RepID=UPI00377054E8